MVSLLCRPGISGGFYAGLRLMGIDGVTFTTPCTPANIRAFGLPKGGHTAESTGGYPLVGKVSVRDTHDHPACNVRRWGVAIGHAILDRTQRAGPLPDAL